MRETDLRYPIGLFVAPEVVTREHVQDWIDEIDRYPAELRSTVDPLSEEQLSTPYRPDGWTVRQLVHHIVDSHLNSYVRFKWTLTEERPTIKAYQEHLWAELPDSESFPVEGSLAMLEILHARWVALLRGMTREDWAREFVHPESGTVRLDRNVGIYAWHGRHHLAHITRLIEREGWKS